MAEDTQSNNEQTTQANTQNQPVQTSQQATQESQSQQQQYRTPPFVGEMRDALNSLPERIAMAVKEAMPQQTTPPPAQSSSNTAQTSATNDDAPRSTEKKTQDPTPPGKRSFSEWYFGVPAGTHRGNG
jgi:hypothetical protein